jgi:hypothetical protein
MTEIEQQQDYLDRVKRAAPKVDAILKEESLNLGAQFDPTKWPRTLQPVPIYTDTKDYTVEVNEVTSPENEPKEPCEGCPKDNQAIESPIQREDLAEPEEDAEGIDDPL